MTPYFSTPFRVAKLQTEARRWLTTPFMAHHMIAGVGADCVGLAAGIYNAVGVKAPTDWPAYSVGSGAYLDASKVVDVVDKSRAFKSVEPVELDSLLPGDLMGFKIGKAVIHHVGIFLGDGLFVHCVKPSGVTRERIMELAWKRRLEKIWRPQDV